MDRSPRGNFAAPFVRTSLIMALNMGFCKRHTGKENGTACSAELIPVTTFRGWKWRVKAKKCLFQVLLFNLNIIFPVICFLLNI